MSDPQPFEEWSDVEELRKQLRRVIRSHEDLKAKHFQLEHVIVGAARASFQAMKPPKVPGPKPDRRKKAAEVAVALAADWQLGRVTPDYDSQVCERRVKQFGEKILEIAEIQRADHPVKECRLWLLGDHVDGETIFPAQMAAIDSSIVDQVITNGARITRNLITRLLEGFETVHVCGVPGNHGRIGSRKGSVVYSPNSNFDRMLYLVVKEWFTAAAETRVTFDIPVVERAGVGYYTVDQIGNYGCMLLHGDQFRGGSAFGGLPFYSITKKSFGWRDMQLSGEIPPFNDLACGHWHRSARLPVGTMTVRVAGTTLSSDPFAHEVLATTSPPAQHLMFVHPGRGMVTSEYTIKLD